MPTSRPLPVLVPERLRRVPRSFAWIGHRLRSGGSLEKLTPEERLKSIAAFRSKVLRLRLQLTAAKEHVKQVNAELQKDIEHYLFLALAAGRHGLSCWRLDRIEREVPFDVRALKRARDGLVEEDLVAFRPWGPKSVDGSYQVLALPQAEAASTPRGGTASLGEVVSEGLGRRR